MNPELEPDLKDVEGSYTEPRTPSAREHMLEAMGDCLPGHEAGDSSGCHYLYPRTLMLFVSDISHCATMIAGYLIFEMLTTPRHPMDAPSAAHVHVG